MAPAIARWLSALAVLTITASEALAEGSDSFSLDLLWTTPVYAAPASAPATTLHGGLGAGLTLAAEEASPGHGVAFLGRQIFPEQPSHQEIRPILLLDAAHGKAEDAVPLGLTGVPCVHSSPAPFSYFFRLLDHFKSSATTNKPPSPPDVRTLAIGKGGEVWVAGSCNFHYDTFSAPVSDAYLARVDASGQLLWERIYSGHDAIQSMTTMPSGDLVVFGTDYRDGWVARLAPDGTPRWSVHLGNNLDKAIASFPDNRLVLAGFEGATLYVWLTDGSGKVIGKTPIRDSIGSGYDGFVSVSIALIDDAFYVASQNEDDFRAQVVEVSKLQLDGKLLWSTDLPDTIAPVHTAAPTWKICSSTLAATPRGDAIVACALGNQIQLYQLDGASGAYQESRIPLPECQKDRSSKAFLAIKDDGPAILAGSPPLINRASNCTWIGKLSRSM